MNNLSQREDGERHSKNWEICTKGGRIECIPNIYCGWRIPCKEVYMDEWGSSRALGIFAIWKSKKIQVGQ